MKKIRVSVIESEEGNIELRKNKDKEQQEKNIGLGLEFETYNDHRMAMAFAPLALIYPEVKVKNPGIVKKSYPDYWNDMKTLGFIIKEE